MQHTNTIVFGLPEQSLNHVIVVHSHGDSDTEPLNYVLSSFGPPSSHLRKRDHAGRDFRLGLGRDSELVKSYEVRSRYVWTFLASVTPRRLDTRNVKVCRYDLNILVTLLFEDVLDIL